MTLRRLFWLVLFIPLQTAAEAFTWLASFPYARLYKENARIREARRVKALMVSGK